MPERLQGGRRWALAGSHLPAAVALGVFADIGYDAPGPLKALPLLVTPWVLIAFSAARLVHRPMPCIAAGIACVEAGLVSYYGWLHSGQHVASGTLDHHYRASAWLALGVVAGAVCGVLGAAAASRRPLLVNLAWAIVVATPIIDARLSLDEDVSNVAAIRGLLIVISVILAIVAVTRGGARPVQLVPFTVVAGFALWQAGLLVTHQVLHRGG